MTDDEIKKLAERLENTIVSSHSSLTRTYSDLQSDTNVQLQKINDSLLGIQKRQDIANGRMAHSELEIQKLKENEIRFAERLENHLSYEEAKEKDEKETKNYWFRNLGWWMFTLISGAFVWMVTKIGKL